MYDRPMLRVEARGCDGTGGGDAEIFKGAVIMTQMVSKNVTGLTM